MKQVYKLLEASTERKFWAVSSCQLTTVDRKTHWPTGWPQNNNNNNNNNDNNNNSSNNNPLLLEVRTSFFLGVRQKINVVRVSLWNVKMQWKIEFHCSNTKALPSRRTTRASQETIEVTHNREKGEWNIIQGCAKPRKLNLFWLFLVLVLWLLYSVENL